MHRINFHLFFSHNLSLWLMLTGIIILTSCEKDPGPIFSNSVIKGYLTPYPGTLPDSSGFMVTASGPYGSQSSLTDPHNSFLIKGLPVGTYTIDISRDGFGSIKLFGIQLFGNDTVFIERIKLFKKVGAFVMPTFLRAYPAIRQYYYPLKTFICVETDLQTRVDMPVILFLGTKNTVSPHEHEYSRPVEDNNFNEEHIHTIYIDPDFMPFKSGTEVFLIGYVCNIDEFWNGYLDTNTGKPLYSTLDEERHSSVVSFIMP
jgi:hypothetical protein